MTQVTDVKPLLTVATYLDDASGYEVYQEVTGRQFQPLEAAPAPVARASGGAAKLQLQTRGSKFVRFQEAKLQERAIEARARVGRGAGPAPLSGKRACPVAWAPREQNCCAGPNAGVRAAPIGMGAYTRFHAPACGFTRTSVRRHGAAVMQCV